MKAVLLVLATLATSACTQVPVTGDPLADLVVARETDWGVGCVDLGSPTRIFIEDENGPPGMAHASSFQDPAIKAAARAIQVVDWQDISGGGEQTIFGTMEGDRCIMQVDRSRISGEFAFVWFSEPGGERGIYAFRRVADQWQVAERVLLGWW